MLVITRPQCLFDVCKSFHLKEHRDNDPEVDEHIHTDLDGPKISKAVSFEGNFNSLQ